MNTAEGMVHLRLDQLSLDLERLRRPKESLVNQMVQSMKKRGQLTPVIVTPAEPQVILVDGFKRVRAAGLLGLPSLNAVAIEADIRKAKAMLYLMNRSGSFSLIEEAMLVKELIELDGLTQSEAALLLDRHKSWVSRRLELIRRLHPEVVNDMLLDLIPGGGGPSLARIPLCNQADFSCAIQNHRLSPNEIRRLTDIFCKASDPGLRQQILQSPKQALEVVKKEIRGATVSWPGKIQVMQRIIKMFEQELQKKSHRLSPEAIAELSIHIDQIKPAITHILSIIEKEQIWED